MALNLRGRLRLALGRRPDADLVFADAGRRAARWAVRTLSGLSRLGARAAPRVLGYAAARRAARAVFGGELRREGYVPVVRVRHALAINATPDGAACTLYSAGFAQYVLRHKVSRMPIARPIAPRVPSHASTAVRRVRVLRRVSLGFVIRPILRLPPEI